MRHGSRFVIQALEVLLSAEPLALFRVHCREIDEIIRIATDNPLS